MNKLWYLSKTLWLNLIAAIGILLFGQELPPETTGIVLTVLNFILRIITKTEIIWKKV